MADMTPQEKAEDLATNVEARFGSLGTFYSWLDVAVLAMELNQLENELSKLKDQQQNSRQEMEVGIQARQAEHEAEIQELRQVQQADYDQWQAKVDAKKVELDALKAQSQQSVGG
jgi:chromosome segregation ATPase